MCEQCAAAPKIFQRKGSEQNCEWRKVLGKSFPAGDHQQQRCRQDQKVKWPLCSFAVAEIKSDIAYEHRRQSYITINDKFRGVVRIPFLTDLGRERADGNLHSRMLVKK